MFRDIEKKYAPIPSITPQQRLWPERTITRPPVWCSVDLRDGNQALVTPMSLDDKLKYFRLLTQIGFKEIEVGFPSASGTEFEFLRRLIEDDLIPDDVTIQVIAQAREKLIERTFDSIRGAKRAIFHLYNNVSPLQRRVVFQTDLDGVTKIAVDACTQIRELGERARAEGMDLIYEYSPEGFSATDPRDSIHVCEHVMDVFRPTPEQKMILNLPTTVENLMPNRFADTVEFFAQSMSRRDAFVLSIHPHNDRGTGVATAELGLLAGAERLEGTLFGNGERTGNVDLVTVAMNMVVQGLDPGLDLSDILSIRDTYEHTTRMHVHERHPYAGALVFTAFSGSHQDAINKGIHAMEASGSGRWEVPYLPIDPADLGRKYDSIIRINSQSGKGGAAFVLETQFGYILPRAMRPEFGAIVQAESERTGSELTPETVYELFQRTYIDVNTPYRLASYTFKDRMDSEGHSIVDFSGRLYYNDRAYDVSGTGNGPIDAFFNAVRNLNISEFHFMSYSEHAVTSGSDSRAAAYIQLRTPGGKTIFGVGLSHNIYLASIRGIICAINREVNAKH